MPRALDAPIQVVVADPQPEELLTLIESQPDMEVVGEARDLPEALRQTRLSDANVLILDLAAPGGDSVALIRLLREERPGLRVLVATLLDEPANVRAALAAGGRGYLLKSTPAQELLEAIRSVHRGGTFVKVTPAAEAEQVAAACLN